MMSEAPGMTSGLCKHSHAVVVWNRPGREGRTSADDAALRTAALAALRIVSSCFSSARTPCPTRASAGASASGIDAYASLYLHGRERGRISTPTHSAPSPPTPTSTTTRTTTAATRCCSHTTQLALQLRYPCPQACVLCHQFGYAPLCRVQVLPRDIDNFLHPLGKAKSGQSLLVVEGRGGYAWDHHAVGVAPE